MPFFDGQGPVAGSLVVFGPDVRLTESRMNDIGRYLRRLDGELPQALGHAG